MEDKRNGNIDILLYALSIVSALLLLILSNKLVTPLISKLDSGAKILDLMFNTEDNIKFTIHLFVPLLLLILGIIILIKTIWNLVKKIMFQNDSMLNKIIMGILSLILVAVLIKALIKGWTLFVILVTCLFISFLILAMLGGVLGSSDTRKG